MQYSFVPQRKRRRHRHPKLDLNSDEHEISLQELCERYRTDLEKVGWDGFSFYTQNTYRTYKRLGSPDFDTSFFTILQGLTDDGAEMNSDLYGANKFAPKKAHSVCFRLMKHSFQGLCSVMCAGAAVCFMSFFVELAGNLSEDPDAENVSELEERTILFCY
jgi:hypothetical protein